MYDSNIIGILRKIKETGGFPGEVKEGLAKQIIGVYATVETSPHTGMILQWSLTKKGKAELKWDNHKKRHPERYKHNRQCYPPRRDDPVAVRPLTIEVLDALKSILDNGHPNTEKLDILARIQRAGGGGYYRKEWIADGPWAKLKDGVWELTSLGKSAAVAHVRKAECAQFTGKVR